MRYLFIIAGLVLLVGCKKSRYDKYAVGSEKHMLVTEHDILVQPDENYAADLDGDGNADVEFEIIRENIDEATFQFCWNTSSTILNEKVQIKEIPNSGNLYVSEGEFYWDPPFPFPMRLIKDINYSSISSEGEYHSTRANSACAFPYLAWIDHKDFIWMNESNEVNLALTEDPEISYMFSETGDSLLRYNNIMDTTCSAIQQDLNTYIAFKISEPDCYRVGWIELSRPGADQLLVLKSGISEKPIRN